MKYLKLFEELINEFSPNLVADSIESAVGGLGTDEDALLSAIKLISSKSQLDLVNSVMNADPKYSYKNIDSVITGELGWLDSPIKSQIESHLTKIKSIVDTESPFISKDPVILSIIDRVTFHEGSRTKVYSDTLGVPTVGVGFNLTRGDAPNLLKKIGANIEKIKSGKSELTDTQVKMLLHYTLTQAKKDCISIIKNFETLPNSIKGVLIEMTFALGRSRFLGFKRFIANIESRKFKSAAKELISSKWAKQVGNRAKTLSNIIEGAANR